MPRSTSTKTKSWSEQRTRRECKRNIDHALHCLATASWLIDKHLEEFTWDERERVVRAVFLVKETSDKYGDHAPDPDNTPTTQEET